MFQCIDVEFWWIAEKPLPQRNRSVLDFRYFTNDGCTFVLWISYETACPTTSSIVVCNLELRSTSVQQKNVKLTLVKEEYCRAQHTCVIPGNVLIVFIALYKKEHHLFMNQKKLANKLKSNTPSYACQATQSVKCPNRKITCLFALLISITHFQAFQLKVTSLRITHSLLFLFDSWII